MLLGVWLLYLSFGLNIAALAPLVPVIESDLGMSHSAMGRVLGAWQFVFILSAIPCGILLDRLGARWAMLGGALLMAVSAFWRSIATDEISLLLAVAVFGLGGPIISTGAPKVVSAWFESRQRGLAMGIYVTGPGIGAIVGLLLTNAVLLPALDNDWRQVLRLWGFFTLITALAWFVISCRLTMAPSHLRKLQTIDLGLLPLLRHPVVRLLLLMSIGVFAINHGIGNWLPELLRASGRTIAQASHLAALMVLVSVISALTIPRLATGQYRLIILFMLCLSSVCAMVLLRVPTGMPLFAGLVFQGIATGSIMTIMMLILVETPGIGERRAGTAGGLYFSTAEIGGVGGPVMLGVVYDATGGFATGLTVLCCIGLVLACCVWALRYFVGKTTTESAGVG
ncbi:Cyanate MFS transporter [hydrothermal vent metagenome]|jgi:cyanate permease|uniref:Cyanate MFS transporter n=1 Tax=hydrothermal vent metagenome TaxID=652676 RepID=A0A160TTW9_9ZZZZ|tara:strand:+ start:3888 stop:5078 length:1191 start_codon:yes stop_codon:yes gene_type:complete